MSWFGSSTPRHAVTAKHTAADPRPRGRHAAPKEATPYRVAFPLALGALVVAVLVGAGTAFAYFAAQGSGAGHVTVGTMQTVTLTAVTTSPSTNVYPGHPGDVVLAVTNPNNYAVTLVSVVGTGGTITPDAGHSNCTTTGVSFVNQSGLSVTIPPNATNYRVDLPTAATMSTASLNSCQGATFSIPVTITVEKK